MNDTVSLDEMRQGVIEPSSSNGGGAPNNTMTVDEFRSGLSASPVVAPKPQAQPPQEAQPDDTDYANMPAGEVAHRALEQALPSAGRAISGLAHAVTNPSETWGAVKQIGQGLYSKAAGAVGAQQDPEEKDKTESLVNALGQHYADTYGSTAGFKKTLATDPFSVGMDIASLAPVVGAGARAAGLTGTAANIVSGATKAASMLDPIQASLAISKNVLAAPVKAADWALGKMQTGASGVPSTLLNVAREAGNSANPAKRAAFLSFMTGAGNYDDIANTALNAVDELKQQASASYLANKSALANSATQLPMDAIDAARKELNDFVGFDGTTTRFPSSTPLVKSINEQLDEAMTRTGPNARTMVDLDNLKQSLSDIQQEAQGTRFSGHIGKITGAIRETITAQDPVYAKMMEDWQNWRQQLLGFQRNLKLGNKSSFVDQTAALMKATQTEGGQNLLQSLSSTKAGEYLPYMLAGAATHSAFPRGLRGMIEYPLGMLTAAVHPGTWPGLAAMGLSSSPRLSGMSQYGIGAAQRLGAPIGQAASAVTSQPLTHAATEIGQEDQPITRATGGRVGDHHERLVSRLMTLAERAKKDVNSTTEPLLNVPDATIVKALHVANQAI